MGGLPSTGRCRMWKSVTPVVLATGSLAIGSLANGAARANPGHESISYSLSPCYGTCPVYTAAVTPEGHVTFEGRQHVAARGKHFREGGAVVWRRTTRSLAPFRPRPGTTTATRCKEQVGHQPHYRIVWTARDGGHTVLTHDRGCISPVNAGLNRILDGLPRIMGIGTWIRAPHAPQPAVRSSSADPSL